MSELGPYEKMSDIEKRDFLRNLTSPSEYDRGFQEGERQGIERLTDEHQYVYSSLKLICECGFETRLPASKQLNNHARWQEWIEHIRSLQPGPNWLRNHDIQLTMEAIEATKGRFLDVLAGNGKEPELEAIFTPALERHDAEVIKDALKNAKELPLLNTDAWKRHTAQVAAKARLEEANDWYVVVQYAVTPRGKRRSLKEGKERIAQLSAQADEASQG